MSLINFSHEKLREIYENSPTIGKGKLTRTDPTSFVNYLDKSVFTMDNGTYCVYINDSFKMYDHKQFTDLYLRKFPDEVSKWYVKDNLKLFSFVLSPSADKIIGDKINLFKGIKSTQKKYDSFSSKTKMLCQRMLDHIKNIICGGSDDQYNYLLKWLKNMVTFVKNPTIAYLKSIQGVGKSIFTDFISQNVIGLDTSLMSNGEPLLNGYNKIFMDKLFVYFDELPTTTKDQWRGISGKMKTYATAKTMTYNEKFEKAISINNIVNYMITTNVDAIQDSEGRRYFILDVSAKVTGNATYFNELAKCQNDKVGNCFYNYLLEHVDNDKFNPAEMPLTNSKSDAIVDHLPRESKFIKNFVLNKKGFSGRFSEFYELFQHFARDSRLTNIGFSKKLTDLGLEKYRGTDNVLMVDFSYEKLLEIATKNQWLHELDEPEASLFSDEPSLLDRNTEIDKLRKENEELKKLLNQQNQKLNLPISKPVNLIKKNKSNDSKSAKTEPLEDDLLEDDYKIDISFD